MIEWVKFSSAGGIIARIDGVEMTVGDDMGNRHRRMISEWEAEGNTITPYTQPPASSEDINAEHDRRAERGKTFDLGGTLVHPDGSPGTQLVIMALDRNARLAAAAGVTAAIFPFTDRNNVDHVLTPQQVIKLMDDGSVFMQQLHTAKRTLKEMTPIPENYADDAWWPV